MKLDNTIEVLPAYLGILANFRNITYTAEITATTATRAKPMAAITSVFKLSISPVSSLFVVSSSSEVAAVVAVAPRESKATSSSSRVVFSSSTFEPKVAKSNSRSIVALRESTRERRVLVIFISLSKTESKMAISELLAVVMLREYKMDLMLSVALFNEFKVEFMEVIFSSMLSILVLSDSISARISSRVAGSASTMKTYEDTIAADNVHTAMNIGRVFGITSLYISVSPILMHFQYIDTRYTQVMSALQHSKNLCIILVGMHTGSVFKYDPVSSTHFLNPFMLNTVSLDKISILLIIFALPNLVVRFYVYQNSFLDQHLDQSGFILRF